MRVYIKSSTIKEAVGVVRARVAEAINQVTTVELELACRVPLCREAQQAVLGSAIQLYLEDVIDGALQKVRFDGRVFEVTDITGGSDDNGVFYYGLLVRPALYQLNYHVHARSFTGKSRIQVIDALLGEHRLSPDTHYTRNYLDASIYPVFNQVLQTGDSDLGFLMRLLAHAGINFYFSCDDSGEGLEMLHLVDTPALFKTFSGQIPVVDSPGMQQQTRRVREIVRATRVVPGKVRSTVFLADGSTHPISKTKAVAEAGNAALVQVFVPEGLTGPDAMAEHAAKVASERFSALRTVYVGESDHLRVRPGWRVTLAPVASGEPLQVLVTGSHHSIAQSVLAALSESGSGDASYTNRFTAMSPLAPIRPVDSWNDVDVEMVLDARADLVPGGRRGRLRRLSEAARGTEARAQGTEARGTEARVRGTEARGTDSEQTGESVLALTAAAHQLRCQVRALGQELDALRLEDALGGGGLIAAEIVEDAWVTDGKELVCRVKAEELQAPIIVKTSAMWHVPGGGTHHLPRKGKHVWIGRIRRGRDHDWCIFGYRVAGAVAAYDPAGTFKLKKFGRAVTERPAAPLSAVVVPGAPVPGFGPVMELSDPGPPAGEADDRPYVVHARLIGAYFDSNKCFLLPTAVGHLAEIKQLYDRFPDYHLLVVGHTDAAGDVDYNDTLSLERADAVAAYLKDDVAAWCAWYGAGKPWNKRWGAGEDRLMIKSLSDYPQKPRDEEIIRWFQRTRGLGVDGVAGPITREALIAEYMAHDNTSLPDGIAVTTHGCGARFPRPDAPPPSEQGAADRHSEMEHRRVEFFFFRPAFGIDPAPPGKTSPEGSEVYPKWYRIADERLDLRLEVRSKQVQILEMHDALFRTNSAVLMPEGEDPSADGDHMSLTSVGLVASVLRYNEEHSDKTLLVAGHCDTSGTVAFNQPLSEERARTALARLTGDREAFKALCDNRHAEVDLTQIFDWAARALGFDCVPPRTDAAPGWEAIRRFQAAYNAWLDEGAAAGETRGPERLAEDGAAGPLTWGGVFDCFEHCLKEELGEDDVGLRALRSQLRWVDPDQPWRGFSEHHPVDNLGRDDYRSQANRRVEILFFDPDEQPDVDLGGGAPEMSDIYLPGHYEREHLSPMLSAKPWRAYWDRADEPATADDRRGMLVDAPGLPAGVPMTFTVKGRVEEALHAPMPPQAVASESEAASLAFEWWFNDESVTYLGELEEGQAMPQATFTFTVEGGGRRLESAALLYRDFLDVVFKHEETDVLIVDSPYTVLSPWATGRGRTDEEGRARVEGLPPGGADVVLGKCYLQDSPRDPVTGGAPGAPPETRTLNLRLLSPDYAPRAHEPYRLLSDFPVAWEGESDSDGLISVDIPTSLTSVRLIVDQCETLVEVADLEDVPDIAGIQIRLNNLGYEVGVVDGELNQQTEKAVLRFRRDRGLGDPGEGELLDDATCESIKDAHGS